MIDACCTPAAQETCCEQQAAEGTCGCSAGAPLQIEMLASKKRPSA